MPPPLLVDTLEVGMTQQARAAGKGTFPASRLDTPRHDLPGHSRMIRFSRHTVSHSDSKFQIAILQRTVNITGTTAGCADARVHATGLFAESWFHRDPFAPLGAPAGNYLLAALGLHARAKSVCLRSLAPVGLECTLGHEKYLLLIRSTVLGQAISINHPVQYLQTAIRKVRSKIQRL